MCEAVRQDDTGEYVVTNDDKLMRCHIRQGREGRCNAGIGGLECGMEQDGHTEVVQDRFSLELSQVWVVLKMIRT